MVSVRELLSLFAPKKVTKEKAARLCGLRLPRQLLLHCSTTGTPDRYIPVGVEINRFRQAREHSHPCSGSLCGLPCPQTHLNRSISSTQKGDRNVNTLYVHTQSQTNGASLGEAKASPPRFYGIYENTGTGASAPANNYRDENNFTVVYLKDKRMVPLSPFKTAIWALFLR
jgi:hypothetical protein